jgi:hypothetical protein
MSGIKFYIPEDVATTPAEGHCYVNRWWAVHPEHGVAFYCSTRRPFLDAGDIDEPSPQCNSNEFTARSLTQRINPDCIVKLIPAVFVGHAVKEMGRQRAARSAHSSTECVASENIEGSQS